MAASNVDLDVVIQASFSGCEGSPPTPSTFLVIAHGVPKAFDPIAPSSISKLNVQNDFNNGDLIRIKWLANNLTNEKQAGCIVLTFINKDTATRCKQTGVFLKDTTEPQNSSPDLLNVSSASGWATSDSGAKTSPDV
ncbi:hypothetical protein PCASD_25239 [Puccinia coronata f. sp. avenae]|uniref:Uncharacterized protein n=1 Tax=Puccinia coronata f. sp. avenae TaxID=200324 RepID=A0A2N5SEF4_9BASI|nr:hypothetical protein PCASD_25239 [Puccinia coronata f. sp. avenae]